MTSETARAAKMPRVRGLWVESGEAARREKPGREVVLGETKDTVNFLNDAYGGTYATDRSLYVNQIVRGGAVYSSLSAGLFPSGAMTFEVPALPDYNSLVSLGSGPDSTVLKISEDASQGNAQFTVGIDGIQVGGVQTATAAHAQLQT